MTVSTTGYINTYTGDNSTDTFSFPNHLQAAADLDVYLDDVLQTITTHYTLDAGSYPATSGTNVVFVTPPGTDVAIKLERTTPVLQDVDFDNLSDFDQDNIELILDRAILISQENRGSIGEALLVPTGLSQFRLPTPVQAELLAWDNIASPLTLVNTGTTMTSFNADVAQVAADAAQVALDVIATAADVVSTNADAVSTAADAVSTAADAAAAAASAGSASAIAAGDISPLANTTGNFTAVDEGMYWVDDGAQITLPSIGYNVGFNFICKTQPPSTGITLVYDSTNPINGYSENVVLKNRGFISVKAPTTSAWTAAKAMLQIVTRQAESTTDETGNATIAAENDLTRFTITAASTATLFPAANANGVVKIKNAASSTHPLIIDGDGSETIDGSTTIEIYAGQGVQLQSDGSNWEIL